MKTSAKKASRLSKKQWVFIGALGIIFILVGWWAWGQVAPKPLGDGLEYLGKKDSGGWFIKGSSEYYYSTDMHADELKTYFKNATYDDTSQDIISHSATYNSTNMTFSSKGGDFILRYYSDSAAVIDAMHLSQSNKRNVISISSSAYNLARNSL